MILTAEIVPAVITAIETETGRPVGHGRIPGTEKEIPNPPFAIVDQLWSNANETSYTQNPQDMMWFNLQVTSIGRTGDQTSRMADKVRYALLGTNASGWVYPIEGAGFVVGGRMLDSTATMEVEESMFQLPERYRLLITG